MADEAPQPRPRRLLTPPRLVLFTGVVFLLFVCLLEGGLQVLASLQDPQTHLPDDGSVEAPDPEAYRVVAVGDSWVYGAESKPGEAFIDVFARWVLEQTGRRVQLYNLGVSASNSAQALVALADVIDGVQPHLVVALTGANDMLHDGSVPEAAQLMGEDLRMRPGLGLLARSRLLRLARLVWINLAVDQGTRPVIAAAPSPTLGESTTGIDAFDRPALPEAPEDVTIPPVPLPWWDLFAQRRWDAALHNVESTPLPGPDLVYRGLQHAWAALLLAHLERLDEAESRAQQALALGGDDATAWEALAQVHLRRDQPLFALQDRIRAGGSAGHPWIKARARGLALLELEAWDPAQVWLLAAHGAAERNLEVLMGLARIPEAARGDVVGDLLFEGPRGMIGSTEYFDWHQTSSGMVERSIASLGDVDAGESAQLEFYRAVGDLLQDKRIEALGGFRSVLDRPEASTMVKARSQAGIIRLLDDYRELEEVLQRDVNAIVPTPSNVGALVDWQRRQDDCTRAIALGQRGLEMGYHPLDFERDAGDCLDRAVGWSLAEQVVGRGLVLDRDALVLGLAPGTLPGTLPIPDLPFWGAFRERRFDAVLDEASSDWRALALAHLERPTEAFAEADKAAAEGGDPAVIAYARSLAHRQEGRFVDALIEATRASTGAGDAWVRSVTRGMARCDALKWKSCQQDLLYALRVAPGYLEALETLSLVPVDLRVAVTEVALRYTPSGFVPAHRWAHWYLAQGRPKEALLALKWPSLEEDGDPIAAVKRQLAQAAVFHAQDKRNEALALLQEAIEAAEASGNTSLGCKALAQRVELIGPQASALELSLLRAACTERPEAYEVASRFGALEGSCARTRERVQRCVKLGVEPTNLTEWMEPCSSVEDLDGLLKTRASEGGAPPMVWTYLRHRLHPGTDDEPVAGPVRTQRLAQSRLVRHLGAMSRLSEAQGALFVALTYPFPGAHHLRLRDQLVDSATAAQVPMLDLYGHFRETFSEAEWQGMRTPQDHVNARGYREMGQVLFEYVKAGGRLPELSTGTPPQ